MRIRFWLVLLNLCCSIATAAPSTGLSLSTPVITKDPQFLHGFRAAIWHQPPTLIWEHTHIFFDAAVGHWSVSNDTPNRSLTIYSVSSILRYYFTSQPPFAPFLNISLGLSYLTQTRLEHRNLGMHFAFQDQVGIGATFGKKQQLSILGSAVHYSNGSLSRHNAGITIPLMVNIEYGFA